MPTAPFCIKNVRLHSEIWRPRLQHSGARLSWGKVEAGLQVQVLAPLAARPPVTFCRLARL